MLRPPTLMNGPNGSGKSTALAGLRLLRDPATLARTTVVTSGASKEDVRAVASDGSRTALLEGPSVGPTKCRYQPDAFATWFRAVRIYAFDANAIAAPVTMKPRTDLSGDGGGLAGVLEQLRDASPECFEKLNDELKRWLPEYDRILFSTPGDGKKAIQLRVAGSQHAIPAAALSQGTLTALALLTLCHHPAPPPLIGLEEPDRGIHPRLLRSVKEGLDRLAYPEQFGEVRPPTQVIATTHSPYFLEQFREHPEEVVVCEKTAAGSTFHRLRDIPHLEEILADTRLGDAWYAGVLGGLPASG
jgi:predicted ATPase